MRTHGLTGTPLYGIWKGMRARCSNPKTTGFKNYGGRGISVCDRWLDPALFVADMGSSYQPGLTLERKEVNGNYEPGNCVWATRQQQINNRNCTRMVVFRGERMAASDAWRKSGASVDLWTASTRIFVLGWDVNRAFMQPSARPQDGVLTHCVRGHPLSGDNLSYVGARRRRTCKACVRLRALKARQKARDTEGASA